MYAFFGFGKYSEQVMNKFAFLDFEFLIIHDEEETVENLKTLGFNIKLGDLESISREDLQGRDPDAILVLDNSAKEREAIISNAEKVWPRSLIITRDILEKRWEKLSLTEGSVLFPANLVTKEILRILEERRSAEEARKLVRVLQDSSKPLMGIFTHDNPDPDAIASAMALKRIALKYGIESRIFHGGKIERADNKVFVYELNLRLERIANPEHVRPISEKLGLIALVDCSIPGSNNILPADLPPNIVIDHHYTEQFNASADFVSLHADLGACSTILTKYLQDLGIPVEPSLASALLYGIRTDTKGFTRNTTSADLKATAYLSALADDLLLEMFQSPPMDERTIEMMSLAIQKRQVENRVLITHVGDMLDRDSLAQVADFLLLLKDVDTVVVFGRMEKTYFISGRNSNKDLHIGEKFKEGFEQQGSAGGHSSASGAQIPSSAFPDGEELVEHLKGLFNIQ